jgi:hypothetical protein
MSGRRIKIKKNAATRDRAVHNAHFAHGAQINFGDLKPYLAYCGKGPRSIEGDLEDLQRWKEVERNRRRSKGNFDGSKSIDVDRSDRNKRD